MHPVPLTTLTRNALADIEGMSNQAKDMCKNAFVLGLVFWMFDRPLDYTLKFYQTKFAGRLEVVEANTRALKAGYYYGETAETFQTQIAVPKREIVEPGVYKQITGNDALVLGLVNGGAKGR